MSVIDQRPPCALGADGAPLRFGPEREGGRLLSPVAVDDSLAGRDDVLRLPAVLAGA